MKWKLDDADRKIIELLRKDARISNAALGKSIGLSEPAARRRVAALVFRGVIKRFTVDVEEGGGVSAIVFLSTSPHASSEKIASQLAGEAGVGAIWETSGDMDVAITLSAPDMDALNKRLDEIRSMDAVKKTQTSVVMKKWR